MMMKHLKLTFLIKSSDPLVIQQYLLNYYDLISLKIFNYN
jgi:hypothetical protein